MGGRVGVGGVAGMHGGGFGVIWIGGVVRVDLRMVRKKKDWGEGFCKDGSTKSV